MNRLTHRITALAGRHPYTTATGIFFAAAIGFMSLGVAIAGTAGATDANVSLTAEPCTATNEKNGNANVVLHVQSDWAGHNLGVLRIEDPGSPWTVTVNAPTFDHTYEVHSGSTWSARLSGTFQSGEAIIFHPTTVIAKALTCTPATVPGTTVPQPTTTTICSQAIPPRQNCAGPVLTVEPTPPVPPTTVAPHDTATAVTQTVPHSTAPPTTGRNPAVTLPTTGPDDALIGAGVAAVAATLCGSVLVIITRRRAK